jgi:hypothetical protein
MGAQLSHGQLGKHPIHAADGAEVAAPQPSLEEEGARHGSCTAIMQA